MLFPKKSKKRTESKTIFVVGRGDDTKCSWFGCGFCRSCERNENNAEYFFKKYTKNCDRVEVRQFWQRKKREFHLAFVFSLCFPFIFQFFFLCYFAIFSHVVHVYKMRRVLSIFITQTPLHLPPHRAALPPFRTVFKNRLQVKFCSFCSKFFIKKMSCRWFRLLSPCESLLNDRFVIMRHLRNFYMNSLNDLTFERASILTMRAAPSLRCGIVIISATTVSIQLILNWRM